MSKETNCFTHTFLEKIKDGNIDDYAFKEATIKNFFSLITSFLGPSVVLLSFFTKDRKKIEVFFSTESENERENYTVYFDELDKQNNIYLEVIHDLKYSEVDRLPFSDEVRANLNRRGFTEVIISPITCAQKTEGFLSVIFSNNSRDHNLEQLFSLIKSTADLISTTFISWWHLYKLEIEKSKAELIIELSNLTLETTKIQIILKSIFRKLQKRDNIESIGFFRTNQFQYSFFQGINISREVEDFFTSPHLKIEELPYYNNQHLMEEPIGKEQKKYCLILPVKATNLSLGFLLIISKSEKKLTKETENFLRIIANQLFLILQRRILLEDIQAITQTSELSFFPVVILDKDNKLIYINNQFEKTFGVKHSESIGVQIESLLKINPESRQKLQKTVKEVLKTLNKRTLRLEVEIEEAGKLNSRTFFTNLSPTINNLTGEYCVVLSLLDITEATKLQELAEEYNARSQMYLNVLLHDVFNIFFAIEGYHEFIQRDASVPQKSIMERVTNLVKRGTEIIYNIRLLSKVLDTSTSQDKNNLPLRIILTTTSTRIKQEIKDKELIIENNIPNMVRIKGGVFVNDFFEYILSNSIKRINSNVIHLVFQGSEKRKEEERYYELKIKLLNGFEPHIKEQIEEVLASSDVEYGVKKQLWLEVVKEIAERNDFELEIKYIDPNDWTKGIEYQIRMPVE
ncbi:MAG: PAS domain-containing protein [Candidatus Heimdallarchaeaceae archaeon]